MKLAGKIENVNLIRKIAWSFHKTTGIEWEELFSQALYKYVSLLNNYQLKEDISKGKLSTHIWTSISNDLKIYIEQYGKIKEPLDHMEDMGELDWYSSNNHPFWEELTIEAQGVANLILKYSQHFVCLTPEQIEQRVINILSKKGWPMDKILYGLNDLENVCNYKLKT